MANLTIIINILKCCIDKLTNKIYNTIRFLCKNRRIQMGCFLTLLMIILLSVPLEGYSAAEHDGRLNLEIFNMEDDMICLSVELEYEPALCGLIARVDYDGEKLEFISADLVGEISESAALTFAFSGDTLNFILDGEDNVFSRRVAEFVFKRRDHAKSERFSFDVMPLEAYRWEGEELLSVRLSGDRLVDVSFPSVGVDIVTNFSLLEGNGRSVLLLEGTKESGCIAAGFDVKVLEVDQVRCESYRTLSVMPKSGDGPCRFSGSVEIPVRGTVCIIACPITFCGNKTIMGESDIFVFSDGVLIDKISMCK